MNARVAALKKSLFESFHIKKEYWGAGMTVLDRPGVEKLPVIARKALAFDLVCDKMPVKIRPNELIVGVMTMSSIAFGGNFPEYETAEDLAKVAQWGMNRKAVFGHHLPYYPKVLQKGYYGIMKDIDEALSTLDASNTEGRDFLEAARSTLVSAEKVQKRYVALAQEAAETESDPVRKAELLEIARICAKVPMQPAETFHEALQSVWSVHMLLHSTLTQTPLGRLDQYLIPYYNHDIEAGTLTPEHAEELIDCFLIKFNERMQFYKYKDGNPNPTGNPNGITSQEFDFAQNGNHWLQSMTLSGKDMHGNDMTNALSYMFIRAINELELVSPMVNARLHKNSPKEFVDFIGNALCDGGAQPVVFNDEVIIKGLIERQHIPAEDAYDYASDGCWEAVIYGRTDYDFAMIQMLHCIEEVINHGTRLLYTNPTGVDMGNAAETLDTFEKFYQAFLTQLRNRLQLAIHTWERPVHENRHLIAPEPFLSNFILDCIENKRDLTRDGARYHQYSMLACGLSHCVDSLCAVKTLVYDKKLVTLETYIDAVKRNWEGCETLRLMAMNKTPKYGNDAPESNAMLVRVMDDFCTEVEKLDAQYDNIIYTPGVATFENYPEFGYIAGASFDGRFAREALSSNFSPAVGRDKEGPTAVLLSGVNFDLSRMSSGCPIDMCLNFSKSDRARNAAVLSDLIRGFISINGCMLTLSRVDVETLKKAQQHPEDYQSLRVRLGGLTAYFVQLAPQQQEEYMRRTEHNI